MNERHEGQLKFAHHWYDNRDLKQELLWQREFLDTGYLSFQQVCFNKWIFAECLKKLKKIEQTKTDISILLEAEKQKDGTYTDVGKGIAIALGLINNEIGE
jgi:hypothetical protein